MQRSDKNVNKIPTFSYFQDRKIPTFSYFGMKIPTFSYFFDLSYHFQPWTWLRCEIIIEVHLFLQKVLTCKFQAVIILNEFSCNTQSRQCWHLCTAFFLKLREMEKPIALILIQSITTNLNLIWNWFGT